MSRVHFIGICGTGMATLAVLMRQRGFDVSGSDEHVYPPMSDLLASQRITVQTGYDEANLPPAVDLVVVGNAVSRGNPEVEAVLDRKLRYASLPEVVRNELLWGTRSLVVSGTHGKTTTAFMLAWLLTEAGSDPSFLIGGVSRNFETSGRLGHGDTFVIEGDEYDSAFFDKTAKFLKYLPEVVVVNSIEFDHADIYRDLGELRLAFGRLVRTIPRTGCLILNVEDPAARALRVDAPCPVETFGLAEQSDWRAVDVTPGATHTSFSVLHRDQERGRVRLPLLGEFNVRNALGALAAAAAVDVPISVSVDALGRFLGVKRRLENRGAARGVTVYDDFAHHPTAVRETLAAMRASETDGRLWAVFEPRSATACRRVFQDEFATSLALADEVVLAAVQRSSLPTELRLSESQLVAELVRRGVSARFLPTVEEIVATVARDARPGDRVVVMSNGSFGGVHQRLLDALDDPSRPAR